MSVKVTVAIAAYNVQDYIETAVEGVLHQSLPSSEREILIVNDGSTDQTLDAVARFDGLVRIIDEPHRGLANACNTGLACARGDYFLRLDADDTLAPDALLMMSNCLSADPAVGCVYSDRIEVYPDGRRVRVSLANFNVFRTIACGVMFRTDIARAIGGYEDMLFEEYDFLIRYLLANPKRWYLSDPLYNYVIHASNMTGRAGYWNQGWKQIIEKWGEAELARWNYREVYQQS